MPAIRLHFAGICCFIDGRENDAFVKRVLLPRDHHFQHHKEPPHIPYVEIESEDLAKGAAVTANKEFKRAVNGNTRSYLRFDLDSERISIRNAGQGNGRLIVVPTFQERVPAMSLVCPDCPPNPREECFSVPPPSDLIAAYFDIRSGYLCAGPVEAEPTCFDQGSNWPPRRLARWGQLDITYQGDHADILLEKFDGSGSRTIPLKRDAAVVTIGNQVEMDIEETSTGGTNRRAHFDMYYELGKDLPEVRPRPASTMGAIQGCAPSNWP